MDNISSFGEDDIPFEAQEIITELVEFQQTHHEPPLLALHIKRLFGPQGYKSGAIFFRKLFEELHSSKYNASSASAFRKSIEKKYRELCRKYQELRSQARVVEREESEEDNIPFEVRKIIDELVEFQQTHHEPTFLAFHIERLFSSQGHKVGGLLFRKLFGELHSSKYDVHSASVFRKGIERRYIELCQKRQERRSQARAMERERARAEFDALGQQIKRTTTRAELIELGRRRYKLAPYTGRSYDYENHCWRCGEHISSAIHAQCPNCKYYICACGACLCGYL